MDVQLTKDAEYLICSIYSEYLEKRKNGINKEDAKCVGGSEEIHKTLMQEWPFEDVDETCWELNRAGMLHCVSADNIAYYSTLTDAAIIYMENRFGSKLDAALDRAGKIKASIPFL